MIARSLTALGLAGLTCAFTASTADAGVSVGNPVGTSKIRPCAGSVGGRRSATGMTPRVTVLGGSGFANAVTWTATSGKTYSPALASEVDLLDSPSVPVNAGEWSDLSFELDGLLVIEGETCTGGTFQLALDMGTWNIPLAEPTDLSRGTVELDIDVKLPLWVYDEVAANGDWLSVDPGDAMHNALVQAVADGSLATVK